MNETDGGCIPVNEELDETGWLELCRIARQRSVDPHWPAPIGELVKLLSVQVTALTRQLDVALDRLAELEAKQGG